MSTHEIVNWSVIECFPFLIRNLVFYVAVIKGLVTVDTVLRSTGHSNQSKSIIQYFAGTMAGG